MFRLPKQSAPIDLQANLILPMGPCQGIELEGPVDLARLIYRPIDGPAFCSAAGSVAFGLCGLGSLAAMISTA